MTANPKELAAIREDKPPLDLLEHCADIEIARALAGGALEYGRRNFRASPIKASVYAGAIRRHIGAWASGQERDPKSGLSHLAHVGACVHVVFAAQEAGCFVNDLDPEVKGLDDFDAVCERVRAR